MPVTTRNSAAYVDGGGTSTRASNGNGSVRRNSNTTATARVMRAFSSYGGSATCDICLEDYTLQNRFTFDGRCGHEYCKECVSHSFEASIEQNNAVLCPAANCQTIPTSFDLEIAGVDSQGIEKWEKRLLHQALYGSGDYVPCPTPDCGNGVVWHDGGSSNAGVGKSYSRFDCNECGQSFCCRCKVVFHEGISCLQHQSASNGGAAAAAAPAAHVRCRRRSPSPARGARASSSAVAAAAAAAAATTAAGSWARSTSTATTPTTPTTTTTTGGGAPTPNSGSEHNLAALLKNGDIQPCPNCGCPTARLEGCDLIDCKMCRAHWMWRKSNAATTDGAVVSNSGSPSDGNTSGEHGLYRGGGARSWQEWWRAAKIGVLVAAPTIFVCRKWGYPYTWYRTVPTSNSFNREAPDGVPRPSRNERPRLPPSSGPPGSAARALPHLMLTTAAGIPISI